MLILIRTPGGKIWANYGHFYNFFSENIVFLDKNWLKMTIVCSLKIFNFDRMPAFYMRQQYPWWLYSLKRQSVNLLLACLNPTHYETFFQSSVLLRKMKFHENQNVVMNRNSLQKAKKGNV